MCQTCYESEGSPAIVNEKTKAAAALLANVPDYSWFGGNLHIVADDWNFEDRHIDCCLDAVGSEVVDEANKERLGAEREFLEAMKSMTYGERVSAMAIHDGFINS